VMVGAAPPERAGAAAGISETSSEFGGALGIAVLGAIGTAVYRGQIDDSVPPGVPADAAEAARDTLGGAVASGDELPGQLAPELVDAAREAFTQALQVAATLNAAVAIGAAILAVALLQRVRTGSELAEERGLEPDQALAGGRPC
jgi:MFS transporter, DHA2 family, multidrug resistance protein